MPDLPVDEKLAAPAVLAFNKLRLPDVPGQPRFMDAGGKWFSDIIAAIYGCIDPKTGNRAINEVFLFVPKKNSKTTNSAGLGILWLLMNTLPHANGIIVGPTQHVADRCFEQAKGMIDCDPGLGKLLKVDIHRKRIIHEVSKAMLEIKSFDMNVVTGGIPVFAIVDELHLMSSKSYATKVLGQIRGGMTKANSLLVMITTQAAEEPSGVFLAELISARNVRDGKTPGEGRLCVLYEYPEAVQMDPDKPWLNPDMWFMVHPNMGRSFTREWLEQLFRKDKEKGEETLQIWLSQHLNIQIGLGLHDHRWIGADYWLAQGVADMTLESLLAQSEVAVIGVDGGGLDDLLGLAVLGRDRDTQNWLHWGKAWAHNEVFERRKNIAERLKDFADQGDLVICRDATSDIEEISEICEMISAMGLLPDSNAIGLDPEGVGVLVDELANVGLVDPQVVAVTQGYRLNSAIKGAPRKLKNGTLFHCNQPFMAWCVGNAKVEARGNAEIVTKAVSGAGKIDPLMALFNAFKLMSANPAAQGRGVEDYFSALRNEGQAA